MKKQMREKRRGCLIHIISSPFAFRRKFMGDDKHNEVVTLCIYTKKNVEFKDALNDCKHIFTKDADNSAMLYATHRSYLARFDGSNLKVKEDGKQGLEMVTALSGTHLDAVYEARVFNFEAELRWLHRSNGRGDAALLTETAKQIEGWQQENFPAGDNALVQPPLDQQYLLWGERFGQAKDGWLKMATARIGAYFVPINLNGMDKGKQVEAPTRVQLNAREYLCQEQKHGNVFVAEERWINLSPYTAHKGDKKGAENG